MGETYDQGSPVEDKRTEFLRLAAEANRLQQEAAELCEQANDSRVPNNEFEVRERAADVAFAALALAEKLLA